MGESVEKETVQEFCQRILPVVQAAADGHAIQTLADGEWCTKRMGGFMPDQEYRIKPPNRSDTPDGITYQPKGSMCVNCALKYCDCSHFNFSHMQVIESMGNTRIVKCVLFERAVKQNRKTLIDNAIAKAKLLNNR